MLTVISILISGGKDNGSLFLMKQVLDFNLILDAPLFERSDRLRPQQR